MICLKLRVYVDLVRMFAFDDASAHGDDEIFLDTIAITNCISKLSISVVLKERKV